MDPFLLSIRVFESLQHLMVPFNLHRNLCTVPVECTHICSAVVCLAFASYLVCALDFSVEEEMATENRARRKNDCMNASSNSRLSAAHTSKTKLQRILNRKYVSSVVRMCCMQDTKKRQDKKASTKQKNKMKTKNNRKRIK